MAIEFKLPELGENITSGDVVNVLVREGDVIAANDGIMELETDKAVVEIPCPHAGKIAKIHVQKGQSVKVGQTLVTIDGEAADTGKPEPAAAPSKPAAAPPPTPTPEKKPEPPPPPSEPEAKPKVVATPGAKKEPAAEEIEPTEAERKPKVVVEPISVPVRETPLTAREDIIPAGPAVRRMARELGIDLQHLQGSGEYGRITLEDVKVAAAKLHAAAPISAPMAAASERTLPPGEPDSDDWGPIRREKMSKIRRTIAQHMAKAASTIPHVTNFDDADITDLEHLRKNVPQNYLGAEIKLTLLPFVVRAVGLSLLKHPTLNASLNDEKEEIIYKQYVNLGIAVDTPRGLIVPVLRDAEQLAIPQIAKELATLSQKVRNAEFTLDEIRGGSFTISNLGAVGGTYSTPIINHPEVAILLLGRARWMASVRDERIESRLMLPLSLSYDHRLVDGATAGRFLNDVIDFLQNPGKLLLAR